MVRYDLSSADGSSSDESSDLFDDELSDDELNDDSLVDSEHRDSDDVLKKDGKIGNTNNNNNGNNNGNNSSGESVGGTSNNIDSITGTGASSSRDLKNNENGNNNNDSVADSIAKKDTKAACHLRVLVISLFVIMSVFVPIVILFTARENEEEGFRSEFEALATKVVDSFEFNIARKLGAIDSLDISMTSYAVGSSSSSSTSTSTQFPFVTMPDFDLRAANTLALADTYSIFFVPIVEEYNRIEWETSYSISNQDWITKSNERSNNNNNKNQQQTQRQRQRQRNLHTTNIEGIIPYIYDFDDNGTIIRSKNNTGPYFPIWQNAPVFKDIVNFNLLSIESLGDGIIATVNSKQAVLGKVLDFKESEHILKEYFDQLLFTVSSGSNSDGHDDDHDGHDGHDDPDDRDDHDIKLYEGEPVSSMFYPVFDKFGQNSTLVALFSTLIFWHTFFEGILPSNAEGMICVIENECNQSFTYEINGQETVYIGDGDLHDKNFDSFVIEYDINLVQQSESFTFREASIPLNQNYCPYILRVYPSKSLQDEYITYKPALYTFCVALAFVLISIVAITYDCVVQSRLRSVLDSALESRAIVSSLFPANVRDRLFEQDGNNNNNNNTNNNNAMNEMKFGQGQGTKGGGNRDTYSDYGGGNDDVHHHQHDTKDMRVAAHPAKLRLKSFLHDDPNNNKNGTNPSGGNNGGLHHDATGIMQTKPIADLFPHCTVLFADIAGFTAWSSEREPAQVFMLLQTIFHFFDNIAKKWGVFKVETIGDCYVAVTGLPDPQLDHAVRMAKFARECLRKVTDLTHKLETTLGPDTGDLCMRFGLHSGPVTAGVLRGEKSRFQLFGDTVNTASRMESTGKKKHIQISQSTADLLVEAGKESWITPREDLVSAKGKGQIQTYWVATRKDPTITTKQSIILTGTGGTTTSPGSNVGSDIFDNTNKSVDDSVLSSDNNGSIISEHSSNTGTDSLQPGLRANAAALKKKQRELRKSLRPSMLLQSNNNNNSNNNNSPHHTSTTVFDMPQLTHNRKLKRLIDWQTDILSRLIKPLIAQRSKKENSKSLSDPDNAFERKGDCVLDEVAEKLILPKFDEINNKTTNINPNSIELAPAVMEQLRDYVASISSKYHDNPFHNFEHASHVTMSASKLLNRIVIPEDVNYQRKNVKAIASDLHDYTYGITSDPLTQFAVIFCSLIHDVDHAGVSNMQLGIEKPDMASKYKNRGLAEQNSVDIAWNKLMQPEYRRLQQCIFTNEHEIQRFRQLVVNLVMATDIFDKEMKTLRNSRWDKAFHRDPNITPLPEEETTNLKATIVIEHIIQAADVAHTMQHWHVYTKWNERLFQEMYLAYEVGRSTKDPSEGWYKGELWFFDNYVIPLAKKLDECNVFGVASDEGLNYALANRAEWAVKGQEIVQDMLQRYKERRSQGTIGGNTTPVATPTAASTPTTTTTNNNNSSSSDNNNNNNNNNNDNSNATATTTTTTTTTPSTTVPATPSVVTIPSSSSSIDKNDTKAK